MPHWLNFDEAPVAYSMVTLAIRTRNGSVPFQQYMFYWTAFNNIYATLARRRKEIPKLVRNPDGTVKLSDKLEPGYKFPTLELVSEKKQINIAVDCLTQNERDNLISSPHTAFFVNRTPSGIVRPFDLLGQRINGVLNLTRTIDPDYPVWSPIDADEYSRFREGLRAETRDRLSQQTVALLYTVRNNLFHGGKRPDNENDVEVIQHALPLLRMVVRRFLSGRRLRELLGRDKDEEIVT